MAMSIVKRKTSANGLEASKNFVPITAKMTAEIGHAIRRQRDTAGVNYWKNSSKCCVPTNIHDRRPSYNKLNHINLAFPGVSLPSLGDKAAILSKKKDSVSLPSGFNSSTQQLMNTHYGKNNDKNGRSTAKKAFVTDLTCLQLADTLFSSTHPTIAGFLNFPPGLIRYMDTLDVNLQPQTEIQSDANEQPNRTNAGYGTTPAPALALSRQRSKTMTCFSSDSVDSPNSVSPTGQNVVTKLCSSDTSSDTNATNKPRPQKSILKTSFMKPAFRDDTDKESVDSKTYRDILMKSTRHPSRRNSDYSYSSPPGLLSLNETYPRKISRKPDRPMTGITIKEPFDNGRKSRVRFSVSHDVWEYTPSEPVCA
ncbi:hypothetical protein CHS0354_025252 [Potamilus streckersoni]|uniref:Uncharacterized protein n=1 Tax=Potamilus streckersoni TaxID=2493646 RepID=A0AAE0RRZ0_9BIVA|nr:hypothetical protein CHS0354_025252 [Potamilus streckersoni]